MTEQVRFQLPQEELPTHWYNIAADLPPMAPAINAKTGIPITPEDMMRTTAPALVEQEFSKEREIAIPEEVRQIYAQWRPTPMFRARRLERELNTPARIYYKYEGDAPTGSFKPNSSVPQVFYNKQAGRSMVVADTGAGQWGAAIAFAASLFDMKAKVFQVRVSAEQKPHRKTMMETFGSECIPSPSTETAPGRATLAEFPDHPGSLAVAKSEALQIVFDDPDAGYTRGSAANHVCLHQTVIGQEAKRQLELLGDYPDIVIGCAGGGSNLAGLAFPFLGEKLAGGRDVQLLAVEPSACPTLTRGRIAYDHSDSGGMTPLQRMHTLGNGFVPPPVHAGGLRAHSIAPLISWVVELGYMQAVAESQKRAFEAGVLFLRAEGVLAAPEATHAIRAAVDEAVRCRETGEEKTILFGLTGHGNFDLGAYQRFAAGTLPDDSVSEESLAVGLASIPETPGVQS
ncbi:TrpB-like pyridoxal phosphate-dependent enzyme [Actinophytocola oryzae]|uniref:tryptophan synthase n=1 Tax=Actinophytocola oryzae TaxID=502181 RepID=A0A4R7VF82_9PSEU|nr:TrpB-like pyridoxal phosphate-dependent enzyme [Actinophytocola oryzae]TDV47883.1 tryptophan synthase beta chain [Actinophytocola oryzae]